MYDTTSVDVIFRFWVTSQLTLAVCRRECRVSTHVSIHIFWMLSNVCLKLWIHLIYAFIAQMKIIYIYKSILTLYIAKNIFKIFETTLKINISLMQFTSFYTYYEYIVWYIKIIVCLIAPLENFSLTLPVKGCKFWPILELGTHGHWIVRVL